MPVIVNEIEVIAPPSTPEENQAASIPKGEAAKLTPHDLYWIERKLNERRTRLQAW